jgi:biopolymer transport protein ExbD
VNGSGRSPGLELHGGTLRRSLAERDANVIPLIDVVFTLILYFMLAGQLDARLLEALAAPLSSSRQKPPMAGDVVAIEADGSVWLHEQPVADAELVRRLGARIATSDRIILMPEADTDAARVADVIALLARADIESVSLITRGRR